MEENSDIKWKKEETLEYRKKLYRRKHRKHEDCKNTKVCYDQIRQDRKTRFEIHGLKTLSTICTSRKVIFIREKKSFVTETFDDWTIRTSSFLIWRLSTTYDEMVSDTQARHLPHALSSCLKNQQPLYYFIIVHTVDCI